MVNPARCLVALGLALGSYATTTKHSSVRATEKSATTSDRDSTLTSISTNSTNGSSITTTITGSSRTFVTVIANTTEPLSKSKVGKKSSSDLSTRLSTTSKGDTPGSSRHGTDTKTGTTLKPSGSAPGSSGSTSGRAVSKTSESNTKKSEPTSNSSSNAGKTSTKGSASNTTLTSSATSNSTHVRTSSTTSQKLSGSASQKTSEKTSSKTTSPTGISGSTSGNSSVTVTTDSSDSSSGVKSTKTSAISSKSSSKSDSDTSSLSKDPTTSSVVSGSPRPGSKTTSATVSATTTSNYQTAPFVVAGSITVPAQTAIETGTFSTSTLSAVTGPPNSYSQTTTTGSDHKSTILPIWFGSDGHGILVLPLSLGGPPGIIPPPPGLPTLEIGTDGKPTEKSDDNKQTSDKNSKQSKTSEGSKTSDSSKTSESSSESTSSMTSCTQSVATQVFESCLTVVGADSTATLSCTTKTSTVTGCKATAITSTTVSTSTASSGPTSTYVIFPQESASKNDRTSFDSTLQNQVGKDKVQSGKDSDGSPLFWRAPLNATQVKDFQSSSAVISAIVPDATLDLDDIDDSGSNPNQKREVPAQASAIATAIPTLALGRRAPISTQNPSAPDELKVVSQAKDTLLEFVEYQYDSSGGKGITVYIADTGANSGNPEYKNMPGNKRFLYSGYLMPGIDETEDDPIGHGSCVLSKVSSPTFGVAKNVDIVMVKMSTDVGAAGQPKINVFTFTSVLNDIKNDIVAKKLYGKAVVNFSWGVHQSLIDDKTKTELQRMVQEITDLGVPITIAAGNRGNSVGVDAYPALFASSNNGLIVVGGTDNNGKLYEKSQPAIFVSIFGPAINIRCMSGSGTGDVTMTGTSFAAPAVAGLAAYFMGLKDSRISGTAGAYAEGVKTLLTKTLAYPRVPGAKENVMWNEIDGSTCNSGKSKRDGSCSRSASASTLVTSTMTSKASSSSKSGESTNTGTESTVSFKTSGTAETTTEPSATSTSASRTTISTASSSPTTSDTSSPSCAPTTVTNGLIQSKAQDDISSFCSYLIKEGPCKNEEGIVLTNLTAACGDESTTEGSPYYDTGNTMNLKVTLSGGDSFAINETLCNRAFSTILNGCPPFSVPDGQTLMKWGGYWVIDEFDAAANFSIGVSPPQAIS